MFRLHQSKGMTLVEMMIAIGITSVVMTMSISIFIGQFKSYHRGKNVKEAQQSGLEVLSLLKSDMMEAGWSVSPRMAFYFVDGGTVDGSDTIVLNDTSLISLSNNPNARFLVLASDYPGCVTMNGSGSSSITVPVLDLNGDLKNDFKPAARQYVISDGTVGSQKIGRITTIAGTTLSLDSSLTGTMVAPGILYCVDEPTNVACRDGNDDAPGYSLHRSDRSSGGRQPLAENVADLQVAYKDDNDGACSINATQAACDAADGCGWLNGQCTGYWYGKAGCAGQGTGAGFCTRDPFDPTRIGLIRLTVVTRSSQQVDGAQTNPNYCRPAVENRTGAPGVLADCGFLYRTYSALIQPRSNKE